MNCVGGSKTYSACSDWALGESGKQQVFKVCRSAVLLHTPGANIRSKRHIEIDFWLSTHSGKAKEAVNQRNTRSLEMESPIQSE